MGHHYDTIAEGIYGDRLGVSHRARKVQAETDDEEIISGKFRPCGGECAAGMLPAQHLGKYLLNIIKFQSD